MSQSTNNLMSVAETARATGLTPAAVKAHDACLRPERVGERKVRLYQPEVVEAFIREREAARMKLDALPSASGKALRRG
jgi:hypothetical protein